MNVINRFGIRDSLNLRVRMGLIFVGVAPLLVYLLINVAMINKNLDQIERD